MEEKREFLQQQRKKTLERLKLFKQVMLWKPNLEAHLKGEVVLTRFDYQTFSIEIIVGILSDLLGNLDICGNSWSSPVFTELSPL